jgi:hypothetical protein
MPRFVLLYHECPPGYERPSHWDILFENGDALRTWALAVLPEGWQLDESQASGVGVTVDAEQLADHRLAYLDFEGPLGGERGDVMRVDGGTFRTLAESPDCWELLLEGQRIRGRITLRRLEAESALWTLTVSQED